MYESLLPSLPKDYAPTTARAAGGGDNPLEQALAAEGVTGPLADVARSVYHQESGSGANTKTSNAGARGGMQIIPTTFASVADKGWDINDPIHNARGGVRYLKKLYAQAGGDPALTAAGYYGGEGGLEKARKGIAVSDPRNPHAPNTLQYAQQVTSRLTPGGAGMPARATPQAQASDTPFYTPVTDHAGLMPPPPPEEGVLASLGTALVQGAKSTARSVGAALNNLTGDLSGVEDNRLAQMAAAEKDPAAKRSLMAEIEARKEANPDAGALQAIGDVGSAAMSNPLGTAQLVVEQAPNAVVSLGGGVAGGKLGAMMGAPLGPVGAAVGGTVGFLAGMFLGNSLLEIGGKSIEKAEGGLTQDEAGEAVREGTIKGAVVTAVDGATLGAGKLISRGLSAGAMKAGARAEAKVLADAGVDITDGAKIVEALADPALRASASQAGQVAAKAASTFKGRAVQAGSILGMETAGEGTGEYLGELAATGEANYHDAALEAVAGFAQSAPETFMAMTRADKVTSTPEAIRASALEQQRQEELAPVQAAADAGGSLSKAAMAGNTGPTAAAQYAAGKEQEMAAQAQTAQAEQQANAPVVDPLSERVRAITEEARTNRTLDALRTENSPVDAKAFVNDLAIAQSVSTRPDQREQALSRLEFAAGWANANAPAPVAGSPKDAAAAPQDTAPAAEPATGMPAVKAAADLLRGDKLSETDRSTLLDNMNAATNPSLPPAARQAARQAANEVIGRNTADVATAPLAPAASTPALFAPAAATPGSAEEVLAQARSNEDSASQLEAMGYPEEAATHAAQADLLREEASVRQEEVQAQAAADTKAPAEPVAATETVAEEAQPASATADPQTPGIDVAAPVVAAPAGAGTAQFRKRRATLSALIADGLNKVERRNDGNFYLVDGSRKRQFKLDGAVDAQLARKAREDSIRAAADATAKVITPKQKIAGNYLKGRPDFEDLKIGIETPIGSERSGTGPDGKPWAVTMSADYGDITGTKGGDGEAVDIYLAPKPKEGSPAFVIDQYNDDGSFDEHKVVLGVATEAEAIAIYDAHFNDGSGPRRRKAVTAMAVPAFKTWVRSPAATQPAGKPNGPARPASQSIPVAGAVAAAPDAGAGVAQGELASGGGDVAGGALPGAPGLAAAVPGAKADPAAGAKPSHVTVTTKDANDKRVEIKIELVHELSSAASPERTNTTRRTTKAEGALLDKLAALMGKRIQFFRDNTGLGDGFIVKSDPSVIYLNERSSVHPLRVFGHEFLHTLRVTMPDTHASLMTVVNEKLKKGSATKFRKDYYKTEDAPDTLDDDALEELVSDVGGDFMGDMSFWAEVFAQIQTDHPTTAKGLIARLATKFYKQIDKLIDGIKQRGFGSDKLVKDLKEVRAKFKEAMAEYLAANNLTQAGLQAASLKAEQKDVKQSATRSPATGIHFSQQQRSEIDGRQYGSGMKGQELARLNNSKDERLLARSYVYIDEGKGVTPETGVGSVPHEVKLPKLYDARVNADKLWNGGDLNATETAILDAGFDGYYVSGKGESQGTAVVLGKASHALKTRPITSAKNGAPTAEPAKVSRGLMSKELNAIEPSRIPGAALKNGTLTIPMDSRDAANDEMIRIGSGVRFSAARQADALPAQYAAVVARLKGTPGWLKAPNGEDTKLTERQWVHVRTPAFKTWFGDWEQFAGQRGGVWNDSEGQVSKAVDDNGEPIVVYHGTDDGGFTEFRKPGGAKRGDLGIFTTSNEEMARSYVKRGRGERIAEIDGSDEKLSGVYASFMNLRTANEADFEGSNWDGSRDHQWTVQLNDEPQYDGGTAYFTDKDAALTFAETLVDEDIEDADARREAAYDLLVAAEDHYESTDSVVRDARRYKNNGAVIRQVMDDGGGRSTYNGEPSDVFVAFEPNQLKSADFNDGSYSVATDDIRFSPKRSIAKDASAAIAQAAASEIETQGKIVNLLRARAKAASLVVDDIGTIDSLVDNALIPTITMQDLVGLEIFPTIADRTAAASIYQGIDSSKLDVGIDLLGGPFFPLRLSNIFSGVVWANRGKGVTSQKAAKLKDGANYMMVVLGSEDMHASNTTVARAFVHTLEAHVRDGRAPKTAIARLTELVVGAGNKGRDAAISAMAVAHAALPAAKRDASKFIAARRAESAAETRLEAAKEALGTSKERVARLRADLKEARTQGGPLDTLRTQLNEAIAAKDDAAIQAKDAKLARDSAKAKTKALKESNPAAKELVKAEEALITAEENLSFFEYLSQFPGFGDADVANLYLDSISFDGRKRIMNLMGSKAAQSAGAPSMTKILAATREPELAGNRWGDGVLLLEVDQEGMQVDLGTDGTREHPDFPIGVRGRVVGRMEKAVNWQVLWQDWLKENDDKDSPRRAFELKKPIVKVTQDLVDRIGSLDQDGIDSSRQAQLAISFASDTWSTSSTPVGDGGASPQAFIDAIESSEASVTLTAYQAPALGKMVKNGTFKIFRLGTSNRKIGKKVQNGQESSIYFGLKYGDPGYAEDYGIATPGITGNEVTLTSVVNNEQGARGIGGPAVILKALQEGVTVLDAFAVKSERFPNGFLPDLYGSFGFEKVAEVPFDAGFYSEQKLADAVKYWKDSTPGYDPEVNGYPPLVIMKWKGTDEQRTGIVERYLRSGIESLLAGGTHPDERGFVKEFGRSDWTAAAQAGSTSDAGRAGGNQGAGDRAPVASRVQSVVQAVAGLSDNELTNLGLTPAQRTAARRALGRGESAPVSDVKLSVPRLAPADRVVWRDIQDVKKDVGLDALPDHITPFADFMEVMADKAGVGALSPRDLIKAYTITRSSVNRAAVATWRATGAGLQLPDSHTDETVRPEGAFAYWLLSDQGQAYLNDAERGTVNEAAIRDAVAIMKPFGMNNTLGEDMRRAVTSDMASLVGKVSDLIDRAHKGEDVVRQWQDAVDGLYGIGYAKKGFMGAMLGYGQLPTFDARQINVQATPDSKKDVLSALGGKRAAEMVDKLSRRLDALDLTMDEKYLPFRQHLVHHAVWDAVGKSATTHTDVMDSMIRASAPRTPDDTMDNAGNNQPAEKANDENRSTGQAASTQGADTRGARGDGESQALDSRPQPGTQGPSLKGLPAEVKVDGQLIRFGGFKPAQDAAAAYAKSAGIDYNPPKTYAKVDPERAKRIADAFEAMPHDPQDPTVKAAYQAMIDETTAQYAAMLATGIEVEFIDFDKTGDPYGNPRNAILDVTRNNHLWIFPTDEGFGGSESADVDISGTPMLQPTRFKISGKVAVANDLFRAVHDYFGHIAEGVGFRADGEENTWRKHAAMFTPLARRALTTETRGQNSWVNFGPYAEFNKTANGADTQYAAQKVGLLPEWASEEGRGDDIKQSPARREDAERVELRKQLSVLESLRKCLG